MALTKSPQDITQKSKEDFFNAGSILRSVFSNWFSLLANIIVGIIITPYIVHRLGSTYYGIWALALQITGYLGAFDIGMRSALVRFTARFKTESDNQALSSLLSMAFLFNCGLALVAIGFGLLLSAYVLPNLEIPADSLKVAQIVVALAAANMAAGFVLAMFKTVLAGLSRWDLINVVAVISLVVRSIMIVVAIELGYGLIALAVIHFLCSSGGYLVNMLQARRLMPGVSILSKKKSYHYLKPVARHSWYAILISGGNRICYEVDSIVIAVFLPVSEVTAYVLGFTLIRYLRELLVTATQVIAPLASSLDAKGVETQINRMMVRGSKFCMLLNALFVAGLFALGDNFLRIWIGDDFVIKSGTVLLILLPGQLVSASQNIPSQILYGLGKHKVNVWCTGLEAGLNLGLSLILVQHYGIYGVAASTSIAVILVRGLLFPRAFLRLLNISWRTYLKHSFLPIILPFGACLIVLGGLDHLLYVGKYPILLLVSLAGSGAFFLVMWFSSLDHAEKKEFTSFLLKAKIKFGLYHA